MTFTLRPYQEEAVSAVIKEFDDVESTLLVASVGAGKTIMQAAFIQRMIADFPDARFVCAVHTRELVTQNYKALVDAWPFCPAGINSAALGQRDTRSQVLFCSIQSVYKLAVIIGWVDCLIIDECHLISPKSTTMYRRFIDDLRAINPDLRILGMSGTPYRMDSGMLVDAEDSLFKTVAFDVGVGRLIDDGFLVPPVSKATDTKFDVSGVHTRGGEYISGELERAVNKSDVTESAVAEVIKFGLAEGRKSWLAFCAGVQHAADVRDAFIRQGVSCAMVEGTMDAGERRRTLDAYKRGEIRCLTNVNVLSIGFNHPPTDLLALMRPTKSPALYVQQVGRGLRLSPGKKNCRVLDFAGVVSDLGPIDAVQIRQPGKGQGEAPIRVCPECQCINHAAARVCIDCGFEFPESDKPKHKASADITPILSTAPPVWHAVTGRTFRENPPKVHGFPPTVKVSYRLGLNVVNDWVCPQHLEHPDPKKRAFPKSKSDRYWRDHGGKAPFPKTVAEFLDRADELRTTAEVQLKLNGKYQNVNAWKAGEQLASDSVPTASNDNWKPLMAAGESWDSEVPF
jgi:DNA repair protein RadD